MNAFRKILMVALIFTVLLAGCKSASSPTMPSVGEPVSIKLDTNPDAPQVGDVEVIITLQDPSGAPFTGANVDVIADHTEMGGMTMHGKATEQGNGQYSVKANFSMSGKWKLAIQVQKDELNFQKSMDLQVK